MKPKKTFGERISWLIDFLLHDIFRVTENELSKTMRFFVRLLKKLILSVRGFIEDDLIIKASALTYYTMLAIVPIFALFLAIGKGFGFAEAEASDQRHKDGVDRQSDQRVKLRLCHF